LSPIRPADRKKMREIQAINKNTGWPGPKNKEEEGNDENS
jgi:hypothetical protein